jgi:hypothetical protein
MYRRKRVIGAWQLRVCVRSWPVLIYIRSKELNKINVIQDKRSTNWIRIQNLKNYGLALC